jgi:hypothetical protein
VSNLSEENTSFQSKFINLSMSSVNRSPGQIREEEDENRMFQSCLLMTKPHYISPFLEVNDDKNLIKIYKSTRSGCFEKSLGCVKHKFDIVSYDMSPIIDQIVQKIQESEEKEHGVFIYGVKSTNHWI